MGYKMPAQPSKLTGKTRASVVGWSETVSKFDNAPQVQFEFETEKGTRFHLWINITSAKSIDVFLKAGILKQISEDEWDIVDLGSQPKLIVSLNEGKLVSFSPIS